MTPNREHPAPDLTPNREHPAPDLTPEQREVYRLTGHLMGHIQAVRHLRQRAELCRK